MPDLITRDDSTRGSLVARSTWRGALGTQAVVDAGDALVFLRDGHVLGALGPGRHVLDPSAIPFLSLALGAGGALASDLLFVSTNPVQGVRMGGPLASVEDGPSGLTLAPRVMGELTLRVVDPVRAVAAVASAPGADAETTLCGFAQVATLECTSALLASAGQEGRLASLVMDPSAQQDLARAVADAATLRLAGAGIAVMSFASFLLALSAEDAEKLRAQSGRAAGATEEPVYEMLWDCKFCGAKKLLGATHRHCPTCGAPQNAEERYFPSDAEKVPAQSHVYYGADVKCAHCGEANSKNSKHCGGCGAPLDTAKEVLRREDRVARAGDAFAGQTAADARGERLGTGAARAPTPPRASGVRRALGIGCGVVVLLVAAAAVVLLWKKTDGVEVVRHTWKRTIEVERFGPVPDSAWCDSMPAGARGVSRSREIRSHERVRDGEECHTRKIDRGNGTFAEKEECSPKYRDEPVYADRCRFTVDRWQTARTATAEGNSLADALGWPDPSPLRAGSCEGCERLGKRREAYAVFLRDPKGAEHPCTFDEDKWRLFGVGSRWKGDIRVLGGSLDCDSLKAP
jgi:membrane protease subunit (stomatin/prohibitin family)